MGEGNKSGHEAVAPGAGAVDLRSDTVTLPSAAMRSAMAACELGDDVYGEDPTVNRLEELAARLAGKEAALFVASGTMGNLASLLAHCGRGQEAILGDESHIYHYENGSASALGGIVYHPVRTEADGTLPLGELTAAIRLPAHNYHYYHYAPPGVICLENTHNRCGGRVLSPDYFGRVAALAAERNLPVHLDGARLFNAAAASKLPITAWTRHVTSVQLCVSKGLAAPVGSIIAGPAAFVDRARRMRKLLGGGMRQAGVLAAPAILALTEMPARLAEDHANAALLADALRRLPGIEVEPVETNIVIFRAGTAETAELFAGELDREGLLVSNFGAGRLRLVTHYGISREDCERASAIMRRVHGRLGYAAAK